VLHFPLIKDKDSSTVFCLINWKSETNSMSKKENKQTQQQLNKSIKAKMN
tara:strand:+ start:427 stop:576 length:150 start_codon:yes stop_codon:yes gene_type:complete